MEEHIVQFCRENGVMLTVFPEGKGKFVTAGIGVKMFPPINLNQHFII